MRYIESLHLPGHPLTAAVLRGDCKHSCTVHIQLLESTVV